MRRKITMTNRFDSIYEQFLDTGSKDKTAQPNEKKTK